MSKYLDENGLLYLWEKITDAIDPKADKVPEVNHGTSDTTFTLTPNIMHIWGEIATLNLTLSADSNSVLDEYMFTFTCPSDAATNLTLPSSIKWIQQPELLAGKTYQVSIVNGLAGYLTDDMPATGQDNIIETVKVNGTALTPDANKAVDITVPQGTVTSVTVNGSNYTPDANGLVNLGTISGESGSGGEYNVIEGVTFNGTTAPITNKIAAITYTAPVTSVNGSTGAVTVAVPGTLNTNNTTAQTASASEALSGTINLHKVSKTGSYNDLLNKPTIPTALADLTADSTHRLVTDTEKSTWNSKADDTGVVHLAGLETITGNKIIQDTLYFSSPDNSCYIKYYDTSPNVHNCNLLLSANDTVYLDSNTRVQGDLIVNSGTSDLIITEDGITTSVTANKSNNKVWNTNGGITDIPSLSKGTTTGSGNAVTDISVSGHTITLTKGSTFLQPGASTDDIEYSEGKGQTMYFLDGTTLTDALQSLDAATSTKATDNLVVHKGGSETITGSKKFQGVYDSININLSNSNNSDITWIDEHNGEAYYREPFAWIKANDGVNTTTLQQALDAKEVTSRKVTSISSSSTDTQYPSALAVYNFGTNLVSQLATIYSGSGAPTSSLGNNGDIYIKVT